MRLTDSKIKAIPKPKKRTVVWEGGTGFGLRVEPTGAKSFVLWYRVNGKAKGVTLGRYPVLGLAQARIEAAKIKGAAKDIKREDFTVSNLIKEYIEVWARPRKKTWEEDQRCLNREVIPFIGGKKASKLRRRDIIGILDRIVDRGSPAMANRTMNVLTRLFNFAVTRDILDQSPCVALSLPAKKGRRERTLSDEEIRAIWFLENSSMTKWGQLAMRFLLATGQRRGEAIGATWEEFDLGARLWSIPGARTKNGRSHAVPLNDLALGTLNEIRSLSGETGFLFSSDRVSSHIDPRALTRAMRKAAKEIGLQNVHVHDTRKAVATGLASLRVDRFIIKKCLNHQEKDVLAIHYDFFEYLDQKRAAMETWGRKLENILTGQAADIIPIHRAAE
ncbi:MAG: site-specific integrase [Nitrospinae bacterium]|nr:site-specific integrase [Nitrospinota bacterium]